jgi:CDP-diacylglycerol--serine O-phosphatidyltransferase
MGIKKHIPNMITCGNLFCGCLAIVCAFKGDLVWSAYLVGIAAVLDFFDGFVARLLKVGGELGKQLDSFADMLTFGVVPGVVMYKMLVLSFELMGMRGQPRCDIPNNCDYPFCSDHHYTIFALVAFLITIFSAVRLAKFNIDTRQTNSFVGLPTPANSILICSFPLILDLRNVNLLAYQRSFMPTSWNTYGLSIISPNIVLNPYFLIGLTILMSYLLVAELPLFALKFKNLGWPDNKIRYSFLIISVILLILFQFIAIPFIIFLYIIMSVINNMMNKNTAH